MLHRKLCLCDNGYVEDKESLKCRKGKTLSKKNDIYNIHLILNVYNVLKFINSFNFSGNKEINDTCNINEQCNGTENANTCQFIELGSKGICTCNQHFEWIEGRCLEGKKY